MMADSCLFCQNKTSTVSSLREGLWTRLDCQSGLSELVKEDVIIVCWLLGCPEQLFVPLHTLCYTSDETVACFNNICYRAAAWSRRTSPRSWRLSRWWRQDLNPSGCSTAASPDFPQSQGHTPHLQCSSRDSGQEVSSFTWVWVLLPQQRSRSSDLESTDR